MDLEHNQDKKQQQQLPRSSSDDMFTSNTAAEYKEIRADVTSPSLTQSSLSPSLLSDPFLSPTTAANNSSILDCHSEFNLNIHAPDFSLLSKGRGNRDSSMHRLLSEEKISSPVVGSGGGGGGGGYRGSGQQQQQQQNQQFGSYINSMKGFGFDSPSLGGLGGLGTSNGSKQQNKKTIQKSPMELRVQSSLAPLDTSVLFPQGTGGVEQSSTRYSDYLFSPSDFKSPENYSRSPSSSRSSDLYSSTASSPVARSKLTLQEMHQQSLRSADGHIYKVYFKRAPRNFILSPTAPRGLKVGDYVKCEADRGEDLGMIVAKVPVNEFKEYLPTAGYRGRGFSTGATDKKYLLRLASLEECQLLLEKYEDEARALEIIREKVEQRDLPMTIIDAEYQFDRHKLVFFFEASSRVDFRELVSELFSLYKTRIWMQQVETSSIPEEDVFYPPDLMMPGSGGVLSGDTSSHSPSNQRKNQGSPSSGGGFQGSPSSGGGKGSSSFENMLNSWDF